MNTSFRFALFVGLVLIYATRPAEAQSTSVNPSFPQTPTVNLSLGSALGVPSADSKGFALRANATDTNQTRMLRDLATQKEATGEMGFHVLLKANGCAHMVIIPAPKVDPKMIERVPREFASNMPRFEGLPSCCRDRREMLTPRFEPFGRPGAIRPLGPELFMPQSGIRP